MAASPAGKRSRGYRVRLNRITAAVKRKAAEVRQTSGNLAS
jgi:hypothetical protein